MRVRVGVRRRLEGEGSRHVVGREVERVAVTRGEAQLHRHFKPAHDSIESAHHHAMFSHYPQPTIHRGYDDGEVGDRY